MATFAQRIPPEEQKWLTGSFVDPNGRVFEWRGEIYRTVEPEYAERWKALSERGVIAELIRDGLWVETELTNLTTDSGRAVLRHRRVPVISYCNEWVPAMLKEAALVVLELCIRLAQKGMTLQDGHPWNILFDATKPVYIDAGSIVPARDDILWAPYQQFCNFFLFPLYLYAAGRDHVARWLLRDYLSGVTDEDLLGALPVSFKLRHPCRTLGVAVPKWLGKAFEQLPEELQQRFFSISKKFNMGPENLRLKVKFFESLRRDVESLTLDDGNSHWARYYRTPHKNYFHTELSPGDWRKKQQAISEILSELGPRTVLDVGTNTGHYARLAAANGPRVVACETDVSALTRCYEQARRERLNLLPLAVNVFSDSPMPGRGGDALPSPTERFRSDLVMGLAVIHHVVRNQRINISRICELLTALTSHWLLLEFVAPLTTRMGADPVPGLDDYRVRDLESCLERQFASVRRLPSYPDDRQLFLCER